MAMKATSAGFRTPDAFELSLADLSRVSSASLKCPARYWATPSVFRIDPFSGAASTALSAHCADNYSSREHRRGSALTRKAPKSSRRHDVFGQSRCRLFFRVSGISAFTARTWLSPGRAVAPSPMDSGFPSLRPPAVRTSRNRSNRRRGVRWTHRELSERVPPPN